ncbi:MAG: hypothetical protein JF601_11640, partial [Acidobacteria bacterium]|nr:hypothetical protein [Acidobacteriota bacterium]
MRKLVLLSCIALSLVVAGRESALPPLSAQASTNGVINPNAYQDLRWRSVGPHRGGRSTAAAGVRTQPNVFYMGTTGGGVWKSDNYGITWSPITDGQLPTGSIGAIDVSDSNPSVVYAGTGSEAIRSNVILGRGVFKSTDAGKTWQSVGLKDVGQIAQLKIHPKNPDIAYVAAVGNPFGWGPDRGVYRTRDGGKTWQKVLFINDQTGAVSIAINWQNPNELYAGAWRAQRKPWTIISGGSAAEGGVYKTTDGGDHWSRTSNGFPDDLVGKVWVDVAQSNPSVVYAQVEAKGAKGGLYRSADSGASWTVVNSSQALRARPFYFNKVFVNPKDENEVWVAELGLHKSTGQPRHLVQSRHAKGDDRDQRRRRQRLAGWRPQLVDAEQSADRGDVPRRRRRAVSVSDLRTAAGHRQQPRGAEHSAGRLGPRRPAAVVGAVARLRERPGAADSVGEDRLWRLQRRVRADEHGDRPGADVLDQPAAALRQESEGHDVP